MQQGLSLAILSYCRISTTSKRTLFDAAEQPQVVAVVPATESIADDPLEPLVESDADFLASVTESFVLQSGFFRQLIRLMSVDEAVP